eukprot:6212223-Pleurochrysis_carterae.AAC.1
MPNTEALLAALCSFGLLPSSTACVPFSLLITLALSSFNLSPLPPSSNPSPAHQRVTASGSQPRRFCIESHPYATSALTVAIISAKTFDDMRCFHGLYETQSRVAKTLRNGGNMCHCGCNLFSPAQQHPLRQHQLCDTIVLCCLTFATCMKIRNTQGYSEKTAKPSACTMLLISFMRPSERLAIASPIINAHWTLR